MSQDPPEKQGLRVFSANLLHGRADVDALAELLAELDPDVIALQEFTDRHVDSVRDALPHGQIPLNASRGMVLALRHPAKIEALADSSHFYCARLEPEFWPELDAPLEVLTGHVCAPHLFPPWTTFPTRRRQVASVLRHIERAPALPRVLVGDLNATPRWPAYRRLCDALEDAALVAAQRSGTQPESTWAPRPTGPRRLRIDHALVRAMQVNALRVVAVPGSDHAGLCVDLSPKAPAAAPELANR